MICRATFGTVTVETVKIDKSVEKFPAGYDTQIQEKIVDELRKKKVFPEVFNALLEKGYIKAERFKNAKNKIGYMYILTPQGAAEKFRQTQHFLHSKTEEYERLKSEIEQLRDETQKRSMF